MSLNPEDAVSEFPSRKDSPSQADQGEAGQLGASDSEQRCMAATRRKTSLQGRQQRPWLLSQLLNMAAGRRLSATNKSLAYRLHELHIFFCCFNPAISNTGHITVCVLSDNAGSLSKWLSHQIASAQHGHWRLTGSQERALF